MGALNSFCWYKYGLLINDSAVATVSLVGGVLMSLYTLCFYCYSIRRSVVQKQVLVATTFFVMLCLYLSNGNADDESDKYVCGLVCCGMAIGFFGSPLVNLVHVLKTKSTSSLPFLMIVANRKIL